MSDATEPGDPFARLEQALNAWLDYVDQGHGTDPDTFLQRVDPELRPLLEPMLTARPEEPPVSVAPKTIGSFRIVREIGRGGMGIVYEAEDQALERHVALKVLGPHFASSPSSLERFRREGAAAARLRHPGIVEVYGIGVDEGVHWIAMELIEGESLSDRLQRGGPIGVIPNASRTAEIAEIGAQVAEALDYAHKQNVVHRDIKPHNVLIGVDGRARLVDFGLAKLLDRESLSTTGEFAGSLAYASPEQLSGSRDLDARTDVWSLGVVLYESLHGVRPFEANTHEAVVRNILTREPAATQGPRDLQVICLKALDKEPTHRFSTASQMAADLRRFLDHEPIEAMLPGTVSRLMRYVRRRRSMTVAVLACVLLGTLAIWLWFDSREQAGVNTKLAESARLSLERLEVVIRGVAGSANPGAIEQHRERVEELVREAERLIQLHPDEPALILTVARANDQAAHLYQLLKLDDETLASHSRAAELFGDLVRIDPEDHEGRLALARSHHNRHVQHRAMGRDDLASIDLRRAITGWQQVIDRAGDSQNGCYARDSLAVALTNRARRALHAPQAATDLDRAVALWNNALDERGLTADVFAKAMGTFTTRAEMQYRLGQIDDARAVVDRVIERIEKTPVTARQSVVDSAHADARILRAKIARTRGEKDVARADLDIALELRRARAADGAADHVIALADVEIAIIGLILVDGKDLAKAATLLNDCKNRFESALARSPGIVHVRNQLARVGSLHASLLMQQEAPAAEIEPALREAIRLHQKLYDEHPSDPLWADLAESQGVYGGWLRKQKRADEARSILARALDSTSDLLAKTPAHPILIRNCIFQSMALLSVTDRRGRHDELMKIARQLMGAIPREPSAVRMSLRACDRAIVQCPGKHAERDRFGKEVVALALQWIRDADAARVQWRRPKYAKSLTMLPHHHELGPLLSAPKETAK